MKILMTAYNSEKYIKESIDSIPSSIPILIGVDGCINTLNYLKKIKENYSNLEILWCPENRGTYITRNTLIKESNEEIIVFLDSDDKYTEDLFNEINENIIEFDLIRWSYNLLQADGSINTPSKGSYYYHANGVFACKRGIFNVLGGYKDWKFSADYDFQIRASENNNIKILKLDEQLMFYRQHNNSLSKTVPLNKRGEIEKNLGGGYILPITHDNYEWVV